MKLFLALGFLISSQHLEASPLFEDASAQPLLAVIETDLDSIKNKKKDYHTSAENFLKGRFLLAGRTYQVKLQTRGHNRLNRCTFPPLRINFDKSEIGNSPLESNHTLKLVTHCTHEEIQRLFREHLIYKIYNLVTPFSFQVRLLKVKYIDINGAEDPIETFAFFIEGSNSVESRLSLHELDSEQHFNMKTHTDISETWANVEQTALQTTFQHFIRNGDWIIFHSGAAGTLSLGNIKFFHDDAEGFPFPYDFDLAGVVRWDDGNYRMRYGFHDLCQDVEMRKAFLKLLSHKQEYIELLNADAFLTQGYKSKFSKYVNQFNSVDDFCEDSNFGREFFSGAATSP
jgi:hypothetical protein